MPELLALLANLYLCDAIVEIRHLTMPEMAECREASEAVQTFFGPFDLAEPGAETRAAQADAALQAFSAWEEANARLVTEMRDAAWLSVRRTGSVLFW